MLGKISFIGGIHGVGKSTICTQVVKNTTLQYLSASDLIKWKEINTDVHNKKVTNIPLTQDRLINGLINAISEGGSFLLDGRYCLINNDSVVTPVPLATFKSIAPVSLHLILGDIIEVKQRLEKRDSKMYDTKTLEELQQAELLHARQVADFLGLELSIGSQEEYSEIITSINKAHQL